jgi:hypothetical protein
MFRPLLGHQQVNLQNIKKEALFIKTLSIVAKQKVLLFTVNITRNRMQTPIIKMLDYIHIVLTQNVWQWQY